MFVRGDKFTVATTLLLGGFFVALFSGLLEKDEPVDGTGDEGISSVEVFRVPLFAEDVPLRQPESVTDTSDLMSRRITGGVVPHHLLASELLAEFFRLLGERAQQPRTIILLAPNHFEVGSANVQTVEFLWETPYGQVATDSEILRRLLETTNATPTPESFRNEHGIYNILPYIAHFLPSTKVVPVILRYGTSAREIGGLVDFLKPLVETGEVLVVGSVDFSHYLPKEESDKKDSDTLRAMRNYDLSRIADFQSDHLDSPVTILTLLRIGQEADAREIRVLRHGNSADQARGSHDSTTGHFSFFLTDLEKESTGE